MKLFDFHEVPSPKRFFEENKELSRMEYREKIAKTYPPSVSHEIRNEATMLYIEQVINRGG